MVLKEELEISEMWSKEVDAFFLNKECFLTRWSRLQNYKAVEFLAFLGLLWKGSSIVSEDSGTRIENKGGVMRLEWLQPLLFIPYQSRIHFFHLLKLCYLFCRLMIPWKAKSVYTGLTYFNTNSKMHEIYFIFSEKLVIWVWDI